MKAINEQVSYEAKCNETEMKGLGNGGIRFHAVTKFVIQSFIEKLLKMTILIVKTHLLNQGNVYYCSTMKC